MSLKLTIQCLSKYKQLWEFAKFKVSEHGGTARGKLNCQHFANAVQFALRYCYRDATVSWDERRDLLQLVHNSFGVTLRQKTSCFYVVMI